MRTTRTLMLLLAAVIALTVTPAAQQMVIQTGPGEMVQMPVPGRQFKTGTGRIRGKVLAAETGGPLRRAQVRIGGQEIAPRAALTDADGRYEFLDLPAGRFTLHATKSGFVTVQFGQTRPFESGRPIDLADKQTLDNADIVMPRGSVISGRILDEFGEPVPDVMVTAMRQSWAGGRRRLVPAGGHMAQTNDLGQFRVYGLPPGEYYITATLRSGMEMMAIEMMSAAGGAVSFPRTSAPASGYAPTYYPGTPSSADAQKITLAVGHEVSNVDFALIAVRLARVTGLVLSADGKPMQGAMVTVVPAVRSESGFLPTGVNTRTSADGAFTLNGVPPGDYLLQANAVRMVTTSSGENAMVFRTMAMGGDGHAEFGSIPLSVSGEDITNAIIMTSKGGTAGGRIIFDDGPPPASAAPIRVSSMPADPDGSAGPFGGGVAAVQADGTFQLNGLAGLRLIRPVALPPGWALKAVRLNGFDITDSGAEFRAGMAVSGLEVVLTARSTSVTGGATGADGSPVKDYTVAVFSENPDHWRLPMTRWIDGTRPDQNGRFTLSNLPPGSYYAVAVGYLAQGDWHDPELLERLKLRARRFTLAEGEAKILDLKLVETY